MNRYFYLAIAATIAFVGLCACAGFAFVEIGNKARTETVSQIDGAKVNAEIAELHKTNLLLNDPQNGIPAILADAHRTELIAAGAITNIEKGTRTWQTKQNAMADEGLAAEKNLNLELTSLQMATVSLSSFLKDQNQNLSQLMGGASQSLTKIDRLSDEFETGMAPTLSNVQKSSANISSTTASMDASAHDIQKFIHRETTPVRGTWNLIKQTLRDFAGPAASVATAFK